MERSEKAINVESGNMSDFFSKSVSVTYER